MCWVWLSTWIVEFFFFSVLSDTHKCPKPTLWIQARNCGFLPNLTKFRRLVTLNKYREGVQTRDHTCKETIGLTIPSKNHGHGDTTIRQYTKLTIPSNPSLLLSTWSCYYLWSRFLWNKSQDDIWLHKATTILPQHFFFFGQRLSEWFWDPKKFSFFF